MIMTRKTVRISELRAFVNHALAASQDDMTGERQGMAHLLERVSMDAGDYHGYNDLVAVWPTDPPDGTGYVADKSYRRWYHGETSGEYAERAGAAAKAYRERMAWRPDAEMLRRQAVAGLSARSDALDVVARRSAETRQAAYRAQSAREASES